MAELPKMEVTVKMPEGVADLIAANRETIRTNSDMIHLLTQRVDVLEKEVKRIKRRIDGMSGIVYGR